MLTPGGLPELRPGIYRHYKGPLYQALGYGHDANDETRVVVLYVPLQLDGAHEGPRLCVRTAIGEGDSWHDRVHLDDRTKCTHGDRCDRSAPRFEWLGYEYIASMSRTATPVLPSTPDDVEPIVHIADRTTGDDRPVCWSEYRGHDGPCAPSDRYDFRDSEDAPGQQ